MNKQKIKDLPCVTLEQILALRKEAIELEQQLAELKASLPKVRAGALVYFSNLMNQHAESADAEREFEFATACRFAAKTAYEHAKLEA